VLISSFVLAFTFATTDPLTEYRETCLAAQLKRFPPPEIVKIQLEFNACHTMWLERGDENSVPPDLFRAWVRENRALGKWWSMLDEAQDWKTSVDKREECLKCLKDCIGDRNFFLGQMPPPAPIWYFLDHPWPFLKPIIPEPDPEPA
jgi:hypothetical protein